MNIPPTLGPEEPIPVSLPVPVISLSPAPQGGHQISLAPGAKIVAPPAPISNLQRVTETIVVLGAFGTIGYWGGHAPESIPTLVGALGLALGLYFRARKRETTGGAAAGAIGELAAPSEAPP